MRTHMVHPHYRYNIYTTMRLHWCQILSLKDDCPRRRDVQLSFWLTAWEALLSRKYAVAIELLGESNSNTDGIQALIHCSFAGAQHLEHHRSIKISTCGIIFLGTPHQGGNGVAWGERLLTVASVFVHTNTKIIDNLRQNSELLQHQLEQYAPISRDFITKFAYETYPTPLLVGPALLVSGSSHAES